MILVLFEKLVIIWLQYQQNRNILSQRYIYFGGYWYVLSITNEIHNLRWTGFSPETRQHSPLC